MNSAANRNLYRMQQGGERLCAALTKIVDNNDIEVVHAIAKKALGQRAQDDFSGLSKVEKRARIILEHYEGCCDWDVAPKHWKERAFNAALALENEE